MSERIPGKRGLAVLAAAVVVLVLSGLSLTTATAGRLDRERRTTRTTAALHTAPTTAPEVVAPPIEPPPAAPPAPVVAPAGALHQPDALVLLHRSATPADQSVLHAVKGVAAVEPADTGTAKIAGVPAATFGVAPGSFRNFTPQPTAVADTVWQYLATGAVGTSFDMARDRKLVLGATVPVEPDATPRWLGAFMSIGLPGVDAIVDRSLSSTLGLVPDSALIVSAPGTNGWDLQRALKKVFPDGDVELLRAAPVVTTKAGSFLSAAQLSTMLTAAESRLGAPYVWGGTGPDNFDCSGLVGWAFRAAGFDLPRTAAQLYLSGPHIAPQLAVAGDLLFWANDPNDPTFIDHVAIYLGNGQMIVAPQTGDVVKISAIPGNHFMGVVRVDPATAGRVGGPRYSHLAGATAAP
jgi:hypothetical protein